MRRADNSLRLNLAILGCATAFGLLGVPATTIGMPGHGQEALGDGPAQALANMDLNTARGLLAQGKAEESLAKARELYGQNIKDPDVCLKALDLMAQCYERQGALEKELLAYEHIGASDWLPRFTANERKRMIARLEAIAGQLEKPEGLPPASLLRLSTMAIGLRKPLCFDELMDAGKPDEFVLRMTEVRALACDAVGNREKADADRLAIVTLRVANRLPNRASAAVAVLKNGDASRDKILALLLDSPDDATAFVCQAALTQQAVESKQWAAALAQLKRLNCLCLPVPEQAELFCLCAGALAKTVPPDAISAADAQAIAPFAGNAPAGRDAAWAAATEAGFHLRAVKAALPEYEAALIQKRLAAVNANPSPAQRRLRVRLLLLSDQVEAALKEAYETYRATPRGLNIQVESARDFVKLLTIRDGTFISAQPFLEFTAFGREGRDGKPGTADDLADPFEAALRK